MKFLIIDDSTSARSFIVNELKGIPEIELKEAESGKEGINLALSFHPDYIILDMELGDINGVEVIKTLRNITETDSIPIIVLTAHDDSVSKARAFEAGAAEFIIKPMSENVLKNYIEDMISPNNELAGCSILVVDDSRETCNLVKRLLEQNGANIFTAGDGKEAIKVLKREKIDVLITDLLMPNMDGKELCAYVRNKLERPELPIIMLTGAQGTVLESLKAGADDYLLKPFSREELFTRVSNHYRMMRFYREQKSSNEKLQHASQLSALGAFASTFTDDMADFVHTIDKATLEIENSLLDDPDSPAMNSLNKIQNSVDGVQKLLKHLKTFSRDNPKAERKKGDLVEHLKESLALFAGKLDKEKILSKIKTDKNIPEIICDFPNIQQAFSNLLINACEAMEDSSKKHLMVNVFEEENEIVVEIEDTGHGITRTNQTKIFDPFFTTKPDVRGAGMGLAVCHGIVEDHGGTLTLVQSSGKGCTFRMALPKGVWFL